MKVIVFDYDGVIIDSQMESFFIAFNTYLKFNPDTKLFASEKFTFDNFNEKLSQNKEIVEKYKRLRPFAKDATCIITNFYIVENDIKVKDQEEYDNFKVDHDIDVKSFMEEFYAERNNIYEKDKKRYLSLLKPCPITGKINPLKEKFHIVISTANRHSAIKPVLEKYDLLFELVVDNTYSLDKRKHMEKITKYFDVSYEDIIFLDDQVSHITPMLPLGVNCFLARWGYNTHEQQEEAKKLGIDVVSEEEFIEKISDLS